MQHQLQNYAEGLKFYKDITWPWPMRGHLSYVGCVPDVKFWALFFITYSLRRYRGVPEVLEVDRCTPTFMVIFYPKASDGHIQLMYEIWTAFQRYEGIPNLKIGHLGVLCHPLASNCSDPSSKFKDRSRDSGHAPLWLLNIKDCRILIQDYTDKVISRNAWLDCFTCNKVRSIVDEEV